MAKLNGQRGRSPLHSPNLIVLPSALSVTRSPKRFLDLDFCVCQSREVVSNSVGNLFFERFRHAVLCLESDALLRRQEGTCVTSEKNKFEQAIDFLKFVGNSDFWSPSSSSSSSNRSCLFLSQPSDSQKNARIRLIISRPNISIKQDEEMSLLQSFGSASPS
jgi:hypothetical protein